MGEITVSITEQNRTDCLFDINHTVSSQSYIHITQYICHVSLILYVHIFAHIKGIKEYHSLKCKLSYT